MLRVVRNESLNKPTELMEGKDEIIPFVIFVGVKH